MLGYFIVYLRTNQLDMAGQSIRRIRVTLTKQNKTNRWLAELMGKPEITISRWVQNKTQPIVRAIASSCPNFISES